MLQKRRPYFWFPLFVYVLYIAFGYFRRESIEAFFQIFIICNFTGSELKHYISKHVFKAKQY